MSKHKLSDGAKFGIGSLLALSGAGVLWGLKNRPSIGFKVQGGAASGGANFKQLVANVAAIVYKFNERFRQSWAFGKKEQPSTVPPLPTGTPPAMGNGVAETSEARSYIIVWYFYDVVNPGYWEHYTSEWMTPAREAMFRSGSGVFVDTHGADKMGYYWQVLFIWQESSQSYRREWVAPKFT